MDAFRINVDQLHIAILIKDDQAGATFEKPELAAGMMQVQLTPRTASAPLYGDGKMRNQENITDGYSVTLDHNKLSPELLAKLKGQEYHTKARRSNVKDVAPYFAMGWGVDQTGGHKEMTWLPKCKLAPSNKNVQQKTDKVEYSTDAFTITSMPLEYNGDYEYIGDTSDEASGFSEEDAQAWFDEVPVAPPKGTTPVAP